MTPAFVIASGRSGSTLLRSLLDGHPDLAVWPFEFSYYSHWEREIGGSTERRPVRELLRTFEPLEFRNFDGYSADLGDRTYQFEPEKVQAFRDRLGRQGDATANRKEFLELVMAAFAEAFAGGRAPRMWVLTINQPTDHLVEDFPGAPVLAAIRHPIHTYVSAKRYYFKAADLTGVDRCAVYRPGAANSAFRLGLLETSVAPIIHTYEWMRRWSGRVRMLPVRLERIQTATEATMREVAAFLGIAYDPILARATLTGRTHGSNMSTGEDSRGRVVAGNWEQSQKYLADLTPWEARWVIRLLAPDCEFAGYDVPAAPAAPGLGLLTPLRHEFPTGQGHEPVPKRLGRWAASFYAYVVNRRVLLRYGRQDVATRWPYAR